MLTGNRINANITTDYNFTTPKHTEWLLLNEGDPTSVPNTLLEKKLFDSLLGHDSLGNEVPSKNLTYRNRYGTGIRPQQTLFKDRLSALRNLISFVNSVFKENRIVGNYSFENLNKVEEIPALFSYEYDAIVEDPSALEEVFTINYVRAELECRAENGKIRSVIITNPGFGYSVAPKVIIVSTGDSVGEIITELDNEGKVTSATIINPGSGYEDGLVDVEVRPHTIIVQTNPDRGNRWTTHSFDYRLRTWVIVKTQKYNTPLYWETVDWVSSTYDSYKTVQYTISDLFAIGSLTTIIDGDYVKVKNIGDGKYAILQKVSVIGNYIPSYNIVYREQGTIQLLDTLWDYTLGKYFYDSATIEETLYDQIPDQELYYILTALKNNIFINSLKVNWNLFFFAAVKYALTEQKLLDWAFKTSFINVFNNIGTLDQRPVYKLNNEEYFENYINEVKPYHTKIRSYTSKYSYQENTSEGLPLDITDFDLPAYYNTITNSLAVVGLGDPLLGVRPWKDWADNYKFYVSSIEVGYAGSGYTQRPTVTITTATGDTGSGATAEAYVRNGELYKVLVTNPGSGYVISPIVTISNSNVGNDRARVSVIMANDTVRKNIIGMKFDRTSTVGDVNNLTVTDEFTCDGVTNKFTLTWLASPDKTSITPLLDGKLIFGSDYTVEYYQVKVSQTGIDVPQTFPKYSWEGETMVDHRYKYFLNTDRSEELPGYIRHYAKFVFLNRVPQYGQTFKVTYNKHIDLYNAVDRINSLYNPTDLMPGKELPLLMEGVDYSGISVQGLMFDQSPNWDSTGTRYDTAPWGDTVNNYTIAKLISNADVNKNFIQVASTDGIFPGQTIVPLNTSTQIFKKNTVVQNVVGNNVYLTTLDIADTMIDRIYSTGTASGSTIIIETKESFNNSINVGDLIVVGGVNSLYGYGIGISIPADFPIESTSTTDLVTVQISPPNLPSGRQATAHVIQNGFTVTQVVMDINGMGYTVAPTVTFNGTTSTSLGFGIASLDPGFNQSLVVQKCTTNYVEAISNLEVSSTATTLNPGASFRLSSVIRRLTASNKLLDTISATFSNTGIATVQTFAPYYDVVRAEISLSTASPTEVLSTSTDTVWYSISNAVDGSDRAIVSLRTANTITTTISGDLDVRLFGATELEFYSYNTDYSNLDSLISGTTLIDTSQGYKPEDIVIDGNDFLNSVDSYAPEECVPGHVRDSIGINVYTVDTPPSYPMVVSGAFIAGSDGITRTTLSWLPDTPLGFRVQANGRSFERVTNEGSFTSANREVYSIFGNTISVNSQTGTTLVGYSFVTAGSDVVVDSNYVATDVITEGNTGTISISSLLPIDEIQSVYVLLNEFEVSESSAPNDLSVLGYVLGPTSANNNRAMVTVNGLAGNTYNLQVWFFDTLYPKFNRLHERFFTIGSTATSVLVLDSPPGGIEPVSEQVIVEKTSGSVRHRLLPPWASYYKIRAGIMTYAIDSKNSRPGTYSLDNVKAYLNGVELRPGYDFTVDGSAQTITLVKPGILAGDAIAITPMVDYDYIVAGNRVHLSSPVTTATIKVTTFTDHDNMMIRTERFKGDDPLILSYPVINENYVWVTLDSKPLIAGFDYMILEDMRTIELSEFVNIKLTSEIAVVVINPTSYGSQVLGYKIFKDMFGRQQFRRLSEYFSTKLIQPLQYTDDKIYLEKGDHLLQPNPGRNLPGVVVIDSERIEYTSKDGNVLSGLRRSTLGTGPAKFSDVGTTVIDQSIRQTIPTIDYSLIQHIPSSNTTTYTISTSSGTTVFSATSSTHAGSGIKFSTLTNAVDQIEVYYGGRQLRKSSLRVHDKSISYYDSADSIVVYPPEFTISTSTRQITLNIAEEITTGTRITIIKKEGALWTGTEATSLLTSNATQANFLRSRTAELPDIYFYGGEKVLLENSNALTDENGEPLEGY